jgi:hypothetical protein
LGSDDAAFMDHYPEHVKITQLLGAIRKNSGRTRTRTHTRSLAA